MPDGLLVLLHDLGVAFAVLLGPSAPTSLLLLVGTTALVAAAATLLARSTRTPVLALHRVGPARARDALALVPVVSQSDPDAPGRARPRAPGLLPG